MTTQETDPNNSSNTNYENYYSDDNHDAPTLLGNDEGESILFKLGTMFTGFCPTTKTDTISSNTSAMKNVSTDNTSLLDNSTCEETSESTTRTSSPSSYELDHDLYHSHNNVNVDIDMISNQRPGAVGSDNSSFAKRMERALSRNDNKNQTQSEPESDTDSLTNTMDETDKDFENGDERGILDTIKFLMIYIILLPSLLLYLLSAIAYFHFGVDLIQVSLTAMKKISTHVKYHFDDYELYEYAPSSTIMIITLFVSITSPLLFFVMKGEQAAKNGNKNLSESDIESISSSEKKKDKETLQPTVRHLMNDLVLDTSYDDNETNNNINVDLDEATENLPPTNTWKYHPVFLQAVGDTKCPEYDNANVSLPIGIPFQFESNLFKGQILVRLRTGKSEEPTSRKAYFDASKIKLHRQIVIQGQFKQAIKMSNVWTGDIYERKLKMAPPPRFAQYVSKFFTLLAPGIIIDFASKKPKVLALIGSGSHSMSEDEPGQEPDIMASELPEKTPISNSLHDSGERKRILGKPETASKYTFDPKYVYTFHANDDVLDIANYTLRMPLVKLDFTSVLGDGQPMSVRGIVSRDGDTMNTDDDFESIFFFRFWHERTLTVAAAAAEKKRKKMEKKNKRK